MSRTNRKTKMLLSQNVELPERKLSAVPNSYRCEHNDVEDGFCLDCGAELDFDFGRNEYHGEENES